MAQPAAMRTLDLMLLALLDSAGLSTDWVRIGSIKHEAGRRKHNQYPEHIRPE